MEDRHYNDEELIERLYGVGRTDWHLDFCRECTERWRELAALRAELIGDPELPHGVLAAQRRTIHSRLVTQHVQWTPRPLAVAAVLAVLAVAVAIQGAPRQETLMAAAEARFFEAIFRDALRPEPRALAPVSGLFKPGERK